MIYSSCQRTWFSISLHTLIYVKIRSSLVVPSSGQRAEALVPSCWLCKGMCAMSWTLCFLIVALSVHLFGRPCLGSAGALAARWQTARSHTALQYHRHKCAHRNAFINTHKQYWNMLTSTITRSHSVQSNTDTLACKYTHIGNSYTHINHIMLGGLYFLYKLAKH